MIDAHAQAETTPTDVVLDPDPPQNPSDIRVELSVIQKIANVGGFCDEECQLLVKHLPSMLLPYYLKLAQKSPSEVPTAKERDACLSEAVTLFQAATDFLHEHQWLQRMLVAQELRWRSRSQELVVPRHHVCEDAASEASKVIKDELKAIPDRLAKLANDPVFGSLDKWTIVGVNTAKPEVALLADSITTFWVVKLGRKPETGVAGQYIPFAKAVFGLVGQDVTYEGMKARLRAAKVWHEQLKG